MCLWFGERFERVRLHGLGLEIYWHELRVVRVAGTQRTIPGSSETFTAVSVHFFGCTQALETTPNGFGPFRRRRSTSRHTRCVIKNTSKYMVEPKLHLHVRLCYLPYHIAYSTACIRGVESSREFAQIGIYLREISTSKENTHTQ